MAEPSTSSATAAPFFCALAATHALNAASDHDCFPDCAGTDDVAASFPPAFVTFLRSNDIHPDNYAVTDVPRYVRVSPRAPPTVDQSELERQLCASIEPVSWLRGYYCVPSNIKIAGSEAYRNGHLYGIDVSSGAAVAALDVQPGDHVLDLCCAPGAKLCALADSMGLQGTLTGVDVSEERLAACRTLCSKYRISNVRLVLGDGRCFATPPPRRKDRAVGVFAGEDSVKGGGEGSVESSGEGSRRGGEGKGEGEEGDCGGGQHDSKRRKRGGDDGAFFYGFDLEPSLPCGYQREGHIAAGAVDKAVGDGLAGNAGGDGLGYDKVLVDAECTHDGSIKHLAKFAQWGWETFERRFLDESRLADLADLQIALLSSGFRNLRPGGTLVYSTCSFARAQNEVIVSKLLASQPTARLMPIETLQRAPCCAGALEHTFRFEPRTSHTSGLFVARIQKLTKAGRLDGGAG